YAKLTSFNSMIADIFPPILKNDIPHSYSMKIKIRPTYQAEKVDKIKIRTNKLLANPIPHSFQHIST
ncbi:hypothetical protein ACS6X6_05105, partial [Streptococcus suis]